MLWNCKFTSDYMCHNLNVMHFFNMSIWNPCRSSDVSTFLLNKSDCKRSKIPESHQQNFWSTWLGGIFFSSVYLNMWCVKGVWIDTRSPPSLMIFGQNFKAHTHMCTLYARKCASAHRTTNRLFKSIQKKTIENSIGFYMHT